MRIKFFPCLSVLILLSGCFTGVENTGRITEKDVAKVKADKKTEEEMFLDSVSPADFIHWRKGKGFYVNDDNIKLIFNASSQYDVDKLQLKGDTLLYEGYKFAKQIDNTEDVVMSFSDGANKYYYNTGKSIQEVESQKSDYVVPFLIDLDFVAKVDSMISGKTLFIKTALWLDSDRKPISGMKYVPVKILSVHPGDIVYPFLVYFEYEGKTSAIYMSSQSSAIRNMAFDKLFSFIDIRKKYPTVSDINWEKITKSEIAIAMTKDECSLALGAPRSIERAATHGGLYERWSYDNGVYLIFENGILSQYRQ